MTFGWVLGSVAFNLLTFLAVSLAVRGFIPSLAQPLFRSVLGSEHPRLERQATVRHARMVVRGATPIAAAQGSYLLAESFQSYALASVFLGVALVGWAGWRRLEGATVGRVHEAFAFVGLCAILFQTLAIVALAFGASSVWVTPLTMALLGAACLVGGLACGPLRSEPWWTPG